MTARALTRPGSWVEGWAVRSQQGSRRNAMVALTALTQRRSELVEVEDFLATRAGHRGGEGPDRDSAQAEVGDSAVADGTHG